MKLASCDNCAHREETVDPAVPALRIIQHAPCALGMAPAEGDFLCPQYEMSAAFASEVLALARVEFQKDVNQAMLEISVLRAERAQAFAG